MNTLRDWYGRAIGFLVEPMREAERERTEFLASERASRFDWEVAGGLVLVAVVLTLQEYLLRPEVYGWLALWQDSSHPGEGIGEAMLSFENHSFGYLLFWALGQSFLYFVPPMLFIRFALRKKLSDYGLKLGGAFSLWGLYLFMLAVMLPIVLLVSRSEGFQHTYPFFKPLEDERLWPRFWIWEAAYFLQFVGLEFFFRGFLLHGTKRRFGAYAVFVMMVPYCMIHFGKPMPETLAAIAAGIILGFMSLKTRSVWMGAALHVSVALSMDLCALWRSGKFF